MGDGNKGLATDFRSYIMVMLIGVAAEFADSLICKPRRVSFHRLTVELQVILLDFAL
jgi:hypothetical protein